MKELINSLKQNIKLIAIILVIGSVLGFVIGKSTNQQISTSIDHEGHKHESAEPQTWTCSIAPTNQAK